MDEVAKLEVAYACKRLTVEYCQLVDHGEAAKTAELFTQDGVLDLGRGEWRGRDAIREAMAARDAMKTRISRHICDNFLITSFAEDRVTATTYLSLYRADVQPGDLVGEAAGLAALGEYNNVFVRTDEGWRIARRVCRIDLRSPEDPGYPAPQAG